VAVRNLSEFPFSNLANTLAIAGMRFINCTARGGMASDNELQLSVARATLRLPQALRLAFFAMFLRMPVPLIQSIFFPLRPRPCTVWGAKRGISNCVGWESWELHPQAFGGVLHPVVSATHTQVLEGQAVRGRKIHMQLGCFHMQD
jgi:hypothetical protein